jgi:diguanylate cyclase (GGDEF)-like protein/PAS domain S-box-containing protein
LDESGSDNLQIALLEHLFADVSFALFVLDKAARVVWSNVAGGVANKSPHDGYAQVPGAKVGDLFPTVFRCKAAEGDSMAAEVLAGILDVLSGRETVFETELPCANQDALHWYRMRVCPLTGRSEYIVSYTDISDRKHSEHELRRYRQLFDIRRGMPGREAKRGGDTPRRAWKAAGPLDAIRKQPTDVFLNSSEAVVVTDAQLRIANVNKGFIQTTGYTFDEVVGRDIGILDADCSAEGVNEAEIHQAARTCGHWQGELKTRRRDNQCFHSWGAIDVVADEHGRPEYYIFVFSDITRIKESQARIHYLAHHDPLTGLANRLLFWARLEQSIAHAARHGRKFALVFVDIDDFKWVNDNLGHPMGDGLLKVIAQRLSGEVRGEDTVARLGGDEFVLVAEDIGSRSNAEAFTCKLATGLAEEVVLDGKSFLPSVSMGLALYPDDGLTPDKLYRIADQTMYRKKTSRRDREIGYAVEGCRKRRNCLWLPRRHKR